MTKRKPSQIVLADDGAADLMLMRKLLAEVELDRIKASLDRDVAEAKKKAKDAAAEYEAEIEAADSALELYWATLGAGGGSLKLTFGTIGVEPAHASTSTRKGWRMATIVGLIERAGDYFTERFLRYPDPELNRNAVLKATDEELATLGKCGVWIDPGEPEFFARVDRAQLAKARPSAA